jgi:hypothetical protein
MPENEIHEEPRPIVLVECPMCHSRVPKTRTTMMSGRRLCLDCANSWFDDEDDDLKDS